MKTYLILYFGTKDVSCSEIAKRIERLGFTTLIGPYDFVYEWKRKPAKKDILKLGDNVCEALHETGSVFTLDTRE